MKKISIIIPVFNVQEYVEKCLRSCAEQDVQSDEYEIIVINDGSLDNSLGVIQCVAKDYDNVVVFSQQNKGLSSARNRGLELARGEYIWFVDSDDWIENNCLKIIFSELINQLDLLHLGICYAYDNPLKNKFLFKKNTSIVSGNSLICSGGIESPAQFTIYRREFLLNNKLHFYSGIYHEDIEFTPRAVFLAKKCKSIDNICYYYYQRPYGSITSTYKLKNVVDILFVLDRLVLFSNEYITNKRTLSFFYRKIGLSVNTALSIVRKLHNDDKNEAILLIASRKNIFKIMMNTRNFKYFTEGLFLYLFPYLAARLYILLKK